MPHRNLHSYDAMRVRDCPAALRSESRDVFRQAMETELKRARRAGVHYAELGGWAVAADQRGTFDVLLLALAVYALSRVLGGAFGITTATVRHSSSSLLKRLGGCSLQSDAAVVEPYYDPRYKCQMELLRFDSANPGTPYDPLIDEIERYFGQVKVIAPGRQAVHQPIPALAAIHDVALSQAC
jgi:hypothetical protein